MPGAVDPRGSGKQAVAGLAARYHDETAPGGRSHRLVVVAHPLPNKPPNKAQEAA